MSEEKNNKHLVVFLGVKTSGKDWNAKPYLEMGYKKISFADPLRNMLWEILGFAPNEKISYSDFKNVSFDIWTKKTGRNTLDLLNLLPEKTNISSIRKMLQNLGSVMKKMFGQEYWAKLWYDNVLQADCNVVCTDCRFEYEIKKALSLSKKGYEVKFVWCCYSGANFKEILKDKHESEALAQYIYWNQDKYKLCDGCYISIETLKKIMKDFSVFQKANNKILSIS